jgi:hypothetical protein
MRDGIETKKVKIRDVLEAAKANGFELARVDWIVSKRDGSIKAGCILGQTAVNLGVAPVDGFVFRGDTRETSQYNLMEQLNKLTVSPSSKWHYGDKSYSRGVGSVITHWNDSWRPDANDGKRKYALRTYKDIVKMMEEVLEPYLNSEIELEVFDFGVMSA